MPKKTGQRMDGPGLQVNQGYISSRGDGISDNYEDVLLTPEMVKIGICDVVGFKPESEGGPGSGSEKFSNGISIAGGPWASGNKCRSWEEVTIRENESRIIPVNISGLGTTYDRVGIVLKNISMFFSPNSISDPNRRYWNAYYSNMLGGDFWTIERGDVKNTIFYDTCPDDVATNTKANLSGCKFSYTSIDVSTGKIQDYSETTPKFPVKHGGHVPGGSTSLKFKLPSDISRFAKEEAYVVVLPIKDDQVDASRLTIEILHQNVLFYDSTDGDKIYSPETSEGDRPNATDGDVNLTNSSFKNLLLFSPGFQIVK